VVLAVAINRFLGSKSRRGHSPRRRSKVYGDLVAHPRVLHVDQEPTDGWFITLRAGWKSADDPMAPVHCFGADTLTKALRDVRRAIPCGCPQCAAERKD
jgi:hypothetical protein